MYLQGDPLATTLRVRVLAVRGLSIADRVVKKELTHSEGEGATAMDKQDGVAIEISNPLAVVRLLHRSDNAKAFAALNSCLQVQT